MTLLSSKVPRALETKTRIFGFELGDLLIVFLYLALSNLIFGTTPLKFLVVWCGTVCLGAFLYYVKRGKPEQYLQDAAQAWLMPGVFGAAVADTDYTPFTLAEVVAHEST